MAISEPPAPPDAGHDHAGTDTPSDASDAVTSWLAPEPDSPRVARWVLTRALQDWEIAGELADDATLAMSELVTNAVVHGGTGVNLCVRRTGEGVRLEVSDGGDGAPVCKSVNADAGSGRGVAIVQALSTRWGIAPSATGKTVWAEFAAR